MKTLKDASIILCEKFTADIEINNESKEITLNNGETIREGHNIYLVQSRIEDSNVDIMKNELVAHAIAEIIANILDVDIISDVARVISCSVDKLEQLVNNITGSSGKEKIEKSRELLEKFISFQNQVHHLEYRLCLLAVLYMLFATLVQDMPHDHIGKLVLL